MCRPKLWALRAALLLGLLHGSQGWASVGQSSLFLNRGGRELRASTEDAKDDLLSKAADLRRQIESLEAEVEPYRQERQALQEQAQLEEEAQQEDEEPTLDGKTVLVVGANGLLGSKVVRDLLRGHPRCQVRALVRRASNVDNYGRLSYEVGAEDGEGDIRLAHHTCHPAPRSPSRIPQPDLVPLPRLRCAPGLLLRAPWITREVTFTATPAMMGYGLDRLELIEGDVRNEEECRSAVQGVDAVIFCAASSKSESPP